MEANLRSEQTESFPKNGEIQDGNTGDHQDLPPTRRVGNLSRLQGCLLPYSNTGTVQEISQISCPGSDIPVNQLSRCLISVSTDSKAHHPIRKA